MSILKEYKSKLSVRETQKAIVDIKNIFEKSLSKVLNLSKVEAPLIIESDTGLNDNLNGIEKVVDFTAKDIKKPEYIGETNPSKIVYSYPKIEVVQSLAKWKRYALGKYGFKPGEGLYTDMTAIRRDEDISRIHSIVTKQWDWELCMTKEQRSKENLRFIVTMIYNVLLNTQEQILNAYPSLKCGKDVLWGSLPENITFITTQELEDMYPSLDSKGREDAICKEKGAVFLMEIGGTLKSGSKHDGRAPDYDQWDLNGDIIVWNPILGSAFELSSMGIRVDADSLVKQLNQSLCTDRLELPYHKALLNNALPLTVGGGIGQSRVNMLLLRKAHIGEVVHSVWPKEMIEEYEKQGITFL